MLYVTIHVKIYLTNLIQYVNLNCICRRLDQNNITGSLDLRNINISGPLNLINLTWNNMGPDFTNFFLYSNISNLLSSGLSIMLESNPCCDNIWKNDMSRLTYDEIYYFCNETPPTPKSKFFYLIYPYFNFLKNNVCVVPCCLNRLGVTYGSNFYLIMT
jgi:hypothetical protein